MELPPPPPKAPEFGADALIVCCSDGAADRRYHLADLLPEAFGPKHL